MRREQWVLCVLTSALVACGDDAIREDERTRDADVNAAEGADAGGGSEGGDEPFSAEGDAAVDEPDGAEADGGDVVEAGAVDLSACDSLGDACCDEGACGGDLACAGSVCSCASGVVNSLIVRGDGRLLDVQADAQSPVRNEATGQPLTGVVAAHKGHSHGCALLEDKSVWCWAASADGNVAGQLGNGETAMSHPLLLASRVRINKEARPAQYLGDVSALQQGFSGYYNSTSCARTRDGSVWCWGARTDGNVTQTGSNEPAAIRIMATEDTPVGDAVEVAVGGRHGCYRTQAGDVYCWGANTYGTLGIGSDQDVEVYPVRTLGVSGALRVTAGVDFACALIGEGDDAGRVLCWGHNSHGQLGIGPPAASTDGCASHCKTTPARVKVDADTYLERVVEIAAGYQGACALTEDRQAWCWGGGLGVGDYAAQLDMGAAPLEAVGQLTIHSREVRLLGTDGRYLTVSGDGATALDVNCGLLD